jgi:hypothetical protein
VLGVVAQLNAHAGVLQLRSRVGWLEVASADLVAPCKKDARERGNARSTDTHEVNLHPLTTSLRTLSTL